MSKVVTISKVKNGYTVSVAENRNGFLGASSEVMIAEEIPDALQIAGKALADADGEEARSGALREAMTGGDPMAFATSLMSQLSGIPPEQIKEKLGARLRDAMGVADPNDPFGLGDLGKKDGE